LVPWFVMRLALVYDCTTTIPTKGRCLDWHGNIVILSNFQQARPVLAHLDKCPVAFMSSKLPAMLSRKTIPHTRYTCSHTSTRAAHAQFHQPLTPVSVFSLFLVSVAAHGPRAICSELDCGIRLPSYHISRLCLHGLSSLEDMSRYPALCKVLLQSCHFCQTARVEDGSSHALLLVVRVYAVLYRVVGAIGVRRNDETFGLDAHDLGSRLACDRF
jgi:hypothetical protein